MASKEQTPTNSAFAPIAKNLAAAKPTLKPVKGPGPLPTTT